jgi:hypothetical protein
LKLHFESSESLEDKRKLPPILNSAILQQGNGKKPSPNRLTDDRAVLRQGFASSEILLAIARSGGSETFVSLLPPAGPPDGDKPVPAKDNQIGPLPKADSVPKAGAPRPGIETDERGRINRVNYPDGSYRTIGYNQGNEPCDFIHFNASGKEIDRMKLPYGWDPAEIFTVKENGAIEKSVDRVYVVRGRTSYDKRGRELSQESSTHREHLFQETFLPDGTHSVLRKYPDASTREIIDRDGKPFRYTYSGKDGTDVWTRDASSNNWYESRDTERKQPWSGTMEFRPDGWLVEIGANGSMSEVSPAGIRGVFQPERWRADLQKLALSALPEADQKQLLSDIKDLEVRRKARELTEFQVGTICREAYRLLANSSRAGVTQDSKASLSLQIVHQGAHPEDVDQGRWGSCNVTDSELRLWYRYPDVAAKVVADVGLTGSYTTLSGEKVDISKSLTPAEDVCLRTPPGDNVRSYATQLVNLVAINLELAEFNRRTGNALECVQGRATKDDHGMRLMDNSTNPPSVVYGFDGDKPIRTPFLKRDDKGQLVLGPDLRPVISPPMDMPGLSIQNSVIVLEKLTGKPQTDVAIGHVSETGQPDNWIWDKIGLANDVRKDSRIGFFKDVDGLKRALVEAERRGKMPVILQCFTGSGFLREQVEKELRAPLGGAGGVFGGPHVICIKSFNEATGLVEIDGTWGRSRDKLGANAVTVAQVFEISKPDSKLLAAQRQFELDKRAAYREWCAKFGKRENVDFPGVEEGKLYLKQYQSRM